MTPDDPLTAALEEIKGRHAARVKNAPGFGFDPVDASRLLAAIDAVLELAGGAGVKGTTMCDCRDCTTARGNGFTGIHRPRPYMWDLDPARVREAITRNLTGKGEPQ